MKKEKALEVEVAALRVVVAALKEELTRSRRARSSMWLHLALSKCLAGKTVDDVDESLTILH